MWNDQCVKSILLMRLFEINIFSMFLDWIEKKTCPVQPHKPKPAVPRQNQVPVAAPGQMSATENQAEGKN